MKQTNHIGYLLGIIASALYGLNPLFALPLYADGMDAWSVLLTRYALSTPLIAVIILCQRGSFRITRSETWQLAGLGFLMAISSLGLYIAFTVMDAGIASTILFIYPILTAVIMAWIFHEHLHWIVVACLIVATIGIVVLAKDDGVANVNLEGVLLVILSAVTYSLYFVFMKKSSLSKMSSTKVTFYIMIFGSLLLLVGVGIRGEITVPQGLHWGYSLGAALFPTAISLIFTAMAIQRIGPTETAILGALEPTTAVIIGVTVFGEQLSMHSIVGILFIIVAVTVVVARNKILAFARKVSWKS